MPSVNDAPSTLGVVLTLNQAILMIMPSDMQRGNSQAAVPLQGCTDHILPACVLIKLSQWNDVMQVPHIRSAHVMHHSLHMRMHRGTSSSAKVALRLHRMFMFGVNALRVLGPLDWQSPSLGQLYI